MNRFDVIKLLVPYKQINVNHVFTNNDTIMHLACYKGKDDIV